MQHDQLGYVGGTLDRAANRRSDAAWIAERLSDPASRFIYIHDDKTVIENGRLHFGAANGQGDPVLLGLDDAGGAVFAARTEERQGLIDLRSIAVQGLLPASQLAMLAQARSMLLWHDRHGFCANCGAATKLCDAGYRRHCESCGTDHFPRTDPVIIMVVRRGEQCLLGRQSFWPKGNYSALAGFMEPGETVEEAARREIEEESGIRTGAIRYVASQPWPYPSSLMIGLIGEAESEQVVVDGRELEDARWFGHEELIEMLEDRHPQGLRTPPKMAIAHHLIRVAVGIG